MNGNFRNHHAHASLYKGSDKVCLNPYAGLSKSECRQGVAQTFRDVTIWDESKPATFRTEALVEFFKMFPTLASERFSGPDSVSRPPLFYFVTQRTSLETIQLIYKMYPKALELDPSNKDSIIYQACIQSDDEQHCYEDVVEFLISQHPDCLRRLYKEKRHSPGYLPLHLVMGRQTIRGQKGYVSLPLIQKFVELFPPCIRRKDNKQRTPLHYAIYEGFHPSVVNFILEQLTEPQISELSLFGRTCHEDYTFDMSAARNLGLVLQRVERFKCVSLPWKEDALLYILNCLRTSCPCLKSLFLNVPDETLYHNSDVQSGLKEFVICNTTVKSLVLSAAATVRGQPAVGYDNDATASDFEHDEFVQELCRGLRSNCHIEFLQLNNMKFRNCNALCELLQTGLSLQTLRLQEIRVLGPCIPCIPWENNLEAASLRNLELVWCTFTFECMNNFLFALGSMASLKSLVLSKLLTLDEEAEYLAGTSRQQPRFDITGPIVEFVKKGQLQHLQIRGISPQVSVQPVCEALKCNTSLKTYYIEENSQQKEEIDSLRYVLARHNATLERVNARQDTEILYYSHLNKFGRKLARQESTAKESFVELLCNIVDNADVERRHYLLHGLLMEACPSLWLGAGCWDSSKQARAIARKRKLY